jgi:hypothetical protein
MTPNRRNIAYAVLVAFQALCLPARAEIPDTAITQARKALADLDALARVTRATGEMPRLSTPGAANIFARLWDVKGILGNPPYSGNDLPVLIDIGALEAAVGKSYLLFSPDPAKVPDTAANTAEYQDEFVGATVFMLAQTSASIAAGEDFFGRLKPRERTEPRRQGIRQMQAGVVELFAGANVVMAQPALRDENRHKLASAIVAHGSAIALGLTMDDRVAIAASLKATMGRVDPATKDSLRTAIMAISKQQCGELCRLK